MTDIDALCAVFVVCIRRKFLAHLNHHARKLSIRRLHPAVDGRLHSAVSF